MRHTSLGLTSILIDCYLIIGHGELISFQWSAKTPRDLFFYRVFRCLMLSAREPGFKEGVPSNPVAPRRLLFQLDKAVLCLRQMSVCHQKTKVCTPWLRSSRIGQPCMISHAGFTQVRLIFAHRPRNRNFHKRPKIPAAQPLHSHSLAMKDGRLCQSGATDGKSRGVCDSATISSTQHAKASLPAGGNRAS